MGKLMGAKIGSLHTLDDLGLYLLVGSPLISGAEPDKKLVQVPGGDFLLDLTRAVDGKVHYLQRTIGSTLNVRLRRMSAARCRASSKRLAGAVAALRTGRRPGQLLGGSVDSVAPEQRPAYRHIFHHWHLQSLQVQCNRLRGRRLAVGRFLF